LISAEESEERFSGGKNVVSRLGEIDEEISEKMSLL
jgi:hypothetical protein